VGNIRHDPFAMLPFCGYNMGDYFHHWIKTGRSSDSNKLPKIFFVNWFRKDENGKFIWPGFGENIRVLKWIFERTSGVNHVVETPIGYLPSTNAIDTTGLNISANNLSAILSVDRSLWKLEADNLKTITNIGRKISGTR
jgi:phosphoenolpyruvate carboxykinase (GTP)